MSPKHTGRRDLTVYVIALLLVLSGTMLLVSLAFTEDDSGDSEELAALRKQVAAVRLADQTHAWQQCIAGQGAIGRFNTLMDTLADQQEAIVAASAPKPRPRQSERAAIYRQAMTATDQFACGEKPRAPKVVKHKK